MNGETQELLTELDKRVAVLVEHTTGKFDFLGEKLDKLDDTLTEVCREKEELDDRLIAVEKDVGNIKKIGCAVLGQY